jgi:cellulose synthase/poly-beta-1,6-N-acetylglucosamine synthase-like glycosyltransferase
MELDYPAERISFHIGDDGSADGTDAVLRGLRTERLNLHLFAQNSGKAVVLNKLLAATTAPIIVFSDANTFFGRDAIRKLVAPFADPAVGAVCGELDLVAADGTNVDSLYWRVERQIKLAESALGGLLGANGAIYAIRRAVWKEIPADTICDDFNIAMRAAAMGYRLVYCPDARAWEEAPAMIDDEYRRRVRIGIGNYQALIRYPEYLFRTNFATRFTYLSHKVLRWVAPHLLIVAILATAIAAPGSGFAKWLLAGELIACATAAILYALSERRDARIRLPKPLRVLVFLSAINWAFLVASIRYVRGRYSGAWQRSAR